MVNEIEIIIGESEVEIHGLEKKIHIGLVIDMLEYDGYSVWVVCDETTDKIYYFNCETLLSHNYGVEIPMEPAPLKMVVIN